MRRSRRGEATILAATLLALAPGAPVSVAGEQAAARPAPVTYTVRGVVQLREKGVVSKDPSLLPENTVIVFEPAARPRAPRPVTAEMSTVKKEFSPRLLVVPVGSSVQFPNLDPILHNVFAISGRNSFDLGLLGKGPGKVAKFHEQGIVRVFCNVHHRMFAYVYVVSSPYWTTAGKSGEFVLEGLPAGNGTLTVWNERSAVQSMPLSVPSRATLSIGLDITMPRIPPHKNKLGRSYSGGNYG
ncbi:MAG: hypothetical protein AB7G12_08780 [Thermoanaerobaculia bacterium]